ncbi:MAG: hypothetical protein HPY83_15620 [Anaerolineae bacterium]|nr:hypothetical protein [Anaerolineae bacterium]
MSPAQGEVRVTVRFGHGLRHAAGGEPQREMRVPSGTRIRDLIDMLGLPQGEVSIVSRYGALASKDDVLRDGDAIGLYPPIGGGC